MTAVTDFLLNRSSEPRLEAPAPGAEMLEQAFACAARAPDHALLRPWRYLVVEGEGLEKLGELFASTCANNSDEKEIEKLRRAPLRAPMIIVGIASPVVHPKVPEIEQVISASVGMGFIELALQEAGFGVMWRTGAMAYHPTVREGLGLEEHEQIVGFLYTGHVAQKKPPVLRPDVAEFTRHWP